MPIRVRCVPFRTNVLLMDAGVGAESRYPGLVTHDKNGRRSGFIISGLCDAAEQRRHAKEFKCARRDETAVEALGAVAGAIEDVEAVVRDDTVKDMILCDIVEEFGAGESSAAAGLVLLGVVDLEGDEAVRISVRKRLHQDIFDNAEYSSGGADAEREGDCSDYGKGWDFAEVAEREADILAERAHRVPPD